MSVNSSLHSLHSKEMLFTVFPAITRTLSTCTADFDLTSCVSSCCTWRRGGMHREWFIYAAHRHRTVTCRWQSWI